MQIYIQNHLYMVGDFVVDTKTIRKNHLHFVRVESIQSFQVQLIEISDLKKEYLSFARFLFGLIIIIKDRPCQCLEECCSRCKSQVGGFQSGGQP